MPELTKKTKIKNMIRNRRMKSIRKYGTEGMSYSSLQEGMQEFRHPAFNGYIAYMRVWGVDYVLSDPITPKSDYLIATILFLEHSKRPVFCQISHAYATLLSYLGLKVNGFGAEHIIDLESFIVSWKVRRGLKRFLSKLTNQKYYVFENVDCEQEKMKISEQWLKNKKNTKELRFLARPYTNILEEDTRTFYLVKDKRVLGFAAFDPIYNPSNSHKPTSYVLQHLRLSSDSPNGAGDFLQVNSLLQLKEEGIKSVSLGLSPLYKRSAKQFKGSRFAEGIFNAFYHTKCFYHFQEVGEHKDRYRGYKKQTFIATDKRFTPLKLLGLLKLNNLI